MRSRWPGVGPLAHGAVTWTDWIDAARAAAVLALRAVGEQTRPERPQADGSAALAADPDDLVAAAYERHQRETHSFALHSTRDPEVAADVTQDTFLKLLREASDGRAPDNVRAWLYRVATNQIINRAKHVAVVDRVRQAWRRNDETVESVETATVRAEQHAAVRAALAELPKDARVGLLLAAQGFGGREVALAIGRSELATRTLLCRARLQLRTRLADHAPES